MEARKGGSPLKKPSVNLEVQSEVKKVLKGVRRSKLSGWVALSLEIILLGSNGVDGVDADKGIDLIHVNNSPFLSSSRNKASISLEEIATGRVSEILELLEGNDRFKKKLERVKRRLENLPYCSTSGHLVLVKEREFVYNGDGLVNLDVSLPWSVGFEYRPHRCNANICPICGYYESRRKQTRLFELLEASLQLGVKLSFLTLTVEAFDNPLAAVLYMLKIRQKIYNTNLSKKLLKRLKPYLFRELLGWGRSLRERDKSGWRKRFRLEKERIREYLNGLNTRIDEFKKDKKTKNRVRIGDLISAVVKLEVHKTPHGWHPHLHSILTEFIPKVLINAFWRYITAGRGRITDIRAVKGKKGVLELAKYETKPVNSKLTDLRKVENGVYQSDGVFVSYEELLLLEFALFGRQKFVVWGDWRRLEEQLKEEEKINLQEEEKPKFSLYKVPVYVEHSMFHLPKALRSAKRLGKKVAVGRGHIDFGGFLNPSSKLFNDLELEELAELNRKLHKVPVSLYALPDGSSIGLEVHLEGDLLNDFYFVLKRIVEDHPGVSKFFKPPDDIVAEYEDSGLPLHLREQIEMSFYYLPEI